VGGDHVIPEVAFEDQIPDLVERAVNRPDLLENIDAVGLFVIEHAQDALHMALDRKQAPAGILAGCGSYMQTVLLRSFVHPSSSAS
jgi:hypothetical protein